MSHRYTYIMGISDLVASVTVFIAASHDGPGSPSLVLCVREPNRHTPSNCIHTCADGASILHLCIYPKMLSNKK